MRPLPVLVVLTLVALTPRVQVSAQTNPRRGEYERDPAIESLVDAAEVVAPEFASDALLRLSTSPRVDQSWRRDIVDDAFFRAYGAQEQYRRSTPQPLSPDTRQGASQLAYSTALTRVSLQVRAARLMTFVDPDRARELFEWIDLNPSPGVCEDPLVPDVEEYYSALGQIARSSYPRDGLAALRFFELYLWRAYLPSEMPSVARAIEHFPRGKETAEQLEGLLRWLLDASSRDARGFSSASGDIVSRVADLQAADRTLGVQSWYLMDSLREYLGTRMKDPRCGDSAAESMVPSAFNAALRRIRASEVKLLGPDVIPPVRQGIARSDPYWQTADSRRLHDSASRLWGPNKAPVSLRVRQTPEWRAQAEQFLGDLEPWSIAREAIDRDVFYQKAVLYTVLVDLVPRSPLRTRAIRSYVEFLRHSEGDRDRRTLWFVFLTRLLEASRESDRTEILNALEETNHPVLWLYARMERTLPQTKP
jgi:hypothetical protein